MSEAIRVGEWCFFPATGTLSRPGEECRLENRAALVLQLFCRRAGDLVSHAELAEVVSNGRDLSQNSVAGVIAHLRRSLGDDSRKPLYIETISKRGYRLKATVEGIADADPMQPPSLRRWRPLLMLLGLCAIAMTLWIYGNAGGRHVTVVVGRLSNHTGESAYDSLVPAVAELVATDLARLKGVRVLAARSEDADACVHGSLILWSGHVAVSLHAMDPHNGAILWSAIANGPSEMLPHEVNVALGDFETRVRTRRTTSTAKSTCRTWL